MISRLDLETLPMTGNAHYFMPYHYQALFNCQMHDKLHEMYEVRLVHLELAVERLCQSCFARNTNT